MRSRGTSILTVTAFLLAAVSAHAERVIIKCTRPCTQAIEAVGKGGGQVTYRYKYVGAIAAEVPAAGLDAVRSAVGQGAVRKDLEIPQPAVARDRDGKPLAVEVDALGAQPLRGEELSAASGAAPDAYLINNAYMNLGSLYSQGVAGQGMKVAVIDSGIRPGFPHISLDGSVIGGEDFVGDGRGYSHWENNGHGTFVAGIISANVVFSFSSTSRLLQSVRTHCPGCEGPAANQIAMIGSAPLSSIYALRVFGPSGGAPESRIIAAMERVLELRENFEAGDPETPNPDGSRDALDIRVCNMSLGGPTMHAGRDLEDELTRAFLEHDIVLVASASNAGPSGTTGGSPGTGAGALTVGASSSAVHERILRDVQYGLGIGALYRPFSGQQTAYFSSRGPTADGRVDPEVVANGLASFGQGFANSTNGITIGSGTSFSAPSVAGVAALLRQAVPGATARQVRNAILLSANPAMLVDGSGPNDRGHGYVDGDAAYQLLISQLAPDTPGATGGSNVSVSVNIRQGAAIQTYSGNVTRSARGLLPGQRFETYYRVVPNTSAVVVTLTGVRPGSVQNVLFGDDILLAVHSAKTSAIGEGDYELYAFTTGGTWVFPTPERGLMRITLNGDWTNASPIGATVNIFSVADSTPGLTFQDKIADGDFRVVPFSVPDGAEKLEALLEFQGDWGSYPVNDIDLILVDPDGQLKYDAATINVPERAVLNDPKAGAWLAIVDGFSVLTKKGDEVQLRIAVDGKVLK